MQNALKRFAVKVMCAFICYHEILKAPTNIGTKQDSVVDVLLNKVTFFFIKKHGLVGSKGHSISVANGHSTSLHVNCRPKVGPQSLIG